MNICHHLPISLYEDMLIFRSFPLQDLTAQKFDVEQSLAKSVAQHREETREYQLREKQLSESLLGWVQIFTEPDELFIIFLPQHPQIIKMNLGNSLCFSCCRQDVAELIKDNLIKSDIFAVFLKVRSREKILIKDEDRKNSKPYMYI